LRHQIQGSLHWQVKAIRTAHERLKLVLSVEGRSRAVDRIGANRVDANRRCRKARDRVGSSSCPKLRSLLSRRSIGDETSAPDRTDRMPGSPYPEDALDDLPSVPADPLRDAHGVDLWWADATAIQNLDLDAACLAMQPDEHARFARYRVDSSRRLYAAGRMLVRQALSRYVRLPPAAWRFGHNEHGKPRLAGPAGAPPVHFNLSHTPGLAVCAVSMVHSRIGVDAESLQRPVDATAIAPQQFSAAEARWLRALLPPRLAPEFMALWTLKESYLKARGEGLALPLAWCSFESSIDGVHPLFDARLADDASAWRFALLRAGPAHLVALAVDTGRSPLRLRSAQLATLAP